MSQTDHIDDIAFSTAFEVDKVLPGSYQSGSFNIGATTTPGLVGNIGTHSLTNNFTENVLPIMIFSSNGNDWYEMSAVEFEPGGTFTFRLVATVYTTASNVVIVGWNFDNATITVHYKVVLITDD